MCMHYPCARQGRTVDVIGQRAWVMGLMLWNTRIQLVTTLFRRCCPPPQFPSHAPCPRVHPYLLAALAIQQLSPKPDAV